MFLPFVFLFVFLHRPDPMTGPEVLFWFSVPIIITYVFYKISRYSPTREFYYHRVKWHTSITRMEFIKINSMLSENIPYYKNLSDNGKAKFVNRLKYFISTKKFIGKEGLEITDEIRILISAAGVQLTFGFDKYIIAHLHTVFVYPGIFHSKLLRKDLKGAAFGGGVVSLSWKHFQEGFRIPDDRINLGLHEMAHALKIDVLKGGDFDLRFASQLDEWLDTGERELSRMQSGTKSFLRAYGGKNEHEFFAVCVEYFFEDPGNFNQKLPAIFEHLCDLLNQNPLNIRKDYSL